MARKRTILVADDEETDRESQAGALRDAGYTVVLAESYTDAIAAYGTTPGISFLVADVALPDGNGCGLASVLQQRQPDLGVLFVSGHVGSALIGCRSLSPSKSADTCPPQSGSLLQRHSSQLHDTAGDAIFICVNVYNTVVL